MSPLRSFVGWWAHLDAKWQIGVPLALLAASGLLLLAGRLFVFGWAAGLVLLALGGKRKSDLF